MMAIKIAQQYETNTHHPSYQCPGPNEEYKKCLKDCEGTCNDPEPKCPRPKICKK